MNQNDMHTSIATRPFLSLPVKKSGPWRIFFEPQRVDTCEFYTLSDGKTKVYTTADALPGCGSGQILNPDSVSFLNLFINGILQPRQNYRVEEGRLEIQTEDIPIKGTPIILQMITVQPS